MILFFAFLITNALHVTLNSFLCSYSCFIGNSGVFFGAVLSPILLIILFNAVVSCMVTVISVRHARNRHKQRKLSSLSLSKVQNKLAIPPGEVCKLVCSLSGVTVLLGLTWILSLVTLVGTGDSVEAAFVVRLFFVLFNSFQGFNFSYFYSSLFFPMMHALHG